jgi:hypothetical protein
VNYPRRPHLHLFGSVAVIIRFLRNMTEEWDELECRHRLTLYPSRTTVHFVKLVNPYRERDEGKRSLRYVRVGKGVGDEGEGVFPRETPWMNNTKRPLRFLWREGNVEDDAGNGVKGNPRDKLFQAN